MRRALLCGLMLILFLSPCLPSQAPESLSLERAVALALDNSLNLQKGLLDLGTAKLAANNLWAEIFPSFSAGAGLNYSSGLFTSQGAQSGQNNLSYSVNLGLSLPLTPGLSSSMKLLTLAYHTQLLSYENSRRQVEIQVAKTFYNLLGERQNLSRLQKLQELAELQLEKSRIAFRNGLTGELSYQRSRLSAETAKLNLSRAEAVYAINLGEFVVLLGFEQHSPVVLEGQIEIFPIEADPEQLIREYLLKRPDIQSQRQNIERLELIKNRTVLNGHAPSLNLSAQWRGTGSPDFNDSLSAGLSLSIPIDAWLPNTKQNQALKSAAADVEKARLDLKSTETGAIAQIRSLTANLRNYWQSIEISRLRVQIAERTYELTNQGYELGTVEFLTLEETKNNMAEAQQQLLADELAYKSMTLDLAVALNLNPDELMRSLP